MKRSILRQWIWTLAICAVLATSVPSSAQSSSIARLWTLTHAQVQAQSQSGEQGSNKPPAAQQQAPEPVPQPGANTPQQKEQPGAQASAPQPDRKITKAEADELFRSVDEILAFVSKDSGLPIKGKIKRQLTSRDQVVKYLEDRMKEDPDTERLDRGSVVMKKLGLIPKNFQLRPFLLQLLREQVAGFYDPKKKTVYLLDWLDAAAQKPVLAHELTHALQDQSFNLEKWSEVDDRKKLSIGDEIQRDEARMARQAVTEGQAMVTLLDYTLAPMGGSVEKSPDVVDLMKLQMTTEGSTPAFEAAPIYLRSGMTFPYSEGLDFIRQVLVDKGKQGAFTGLFTKPPADTRQIMQPKMYLESEPVQMVGVADLDKVVGTDVERFDWGGLGEFDIRVISTQWATNDDGKQLAPGWRGGYYLAYRKKGSTTDPVKLAVAIKFETPEYAQSFLRVYRAGLKQRYKSLTTKTDLVETEDGPVILTTDGELFIATESFDAQTAAKIRQAIISNARVSQAHLISNTSAVIH